MAAFATNPYDATRTDLYVEDYYVLYTTGDITQGLLRIVRPCGNETTGDTTTWVEFNDKENCPKLNRHLTRKLKKLERLYSDKKKIKECLLIQTNPYLAFLVPKNLTFLTKKMGHAPKIEMRSRANLKAGRRPPMVRYRLQKFCRGEK